MFGLSSSAALVLGAATFALFVIMGFARALSKR